MEPGMNSARFIQLQNELYGSACIYSRVKNNIIKKAQEDFLKTLKLETKLTTVYSLSCCSYKL